MKWIKNTENSVFTFGEYKGQSVHDVVREDPHYILRLHEDPHYKVSAALVQKARSKADKHFFVVEGLV